MRFHKKLNCGWTNPEAYKISLGCTRAKKLKDKEALESELVTYDNFYHVLCTPPMRRGKRTVAFVPEYIEGPFHVGFTDDCIQQLEEGCVLWSSSKITVAGVRVKRKAFSVRPTKPGIPIYCTVDLDEDEVTFDYQGESCTVPWKPVSKPVYAGLFLLKPGACMKLL